MPDVTMFLIYFLFAFTLTQCFGNPISPAQDDKLIGVAVLFRHGDRSPIESYPNDPYIDIKYWPEGLGQLLDQGKKRQFELGKYLRNRYNDFIPLQYNRKDILVKSTDVDRTLMSAASNLAGLYFKTNKSTYWEDNLPWDPIPIHTTPEEDDPVLAEGKDCPNFSKLYETTLNSSHFRNIVQNHSGIKSVVEKNTNWTIDSIKFYQNLYTVFYVYQSTNSSYLPPWSRDLDMSELSHLAGISFSSETFTSELQRFRFGPFFHYLHHYFDGIIKGKKPRFLMLSAHDTTVAGILNTYGAYDYHPPEFAEAIIWELRRRADEVFLKIFNKRNPGNAAEIRLAGCAEECDYERYKKTLEHVAVDPEKWEEDCYN
ncbi:unnamed protein product [Phyllotreta striolata]|uniref:acid phosphatase n=1 Tax=Phyllotreta striolata TaxID=444603 RepID=A0A9N9THH4_PHYSR|nr:unnamed protein product [Phyllotreta striolata]